MRSKTPILDATIERMAQLALETGEDLPSNITPDQAATAYLLAFTENGGRLSRLAQDLGVSRFLLQRWIWRDEERKQSYAHARTLGSHALVDEGGDILDTATRDTVAVANAQAGWRKWLASKYDPSTYGDKQQGGITVGALHLHAALPLPSYTTPPLDGSLDTVRDVGYPTEPKALPSGEIIVDPPHDTVGLG